MPLRAVSLRVRIFFAVSALVLLLGIVLAAAFLFRSQNDLSESFRWVEHTQLVQNKIDQFLLALRDAESAQRGYLLTGRAVYLEPYSQAAESVTTHFNDLRTLNEDYPQQLEHLNEIEPLARQKLQFITDSIGLVQNGDVEAALKMVNTDRGKNLMDTIRALAAKMGRAQTALLLEQEEALTRRTRQHSVALVCVLGWTGVLMAVLLAFIAHNSRLKKLVKMCAWSKTIHWEGKWMTVEVYLKKRFDIDVMDSMSPQEAEKFRKGLGQFGPD
jgi:CHASE3 domain sensor protein